MSLSGCVGLTGAGTPAATNTSGALGTLAASATSLPFGNVTVGSSSTVTLTLTNSGTAAVTISNATVTGTEFSIVGGASSVSIPAGQNHAFQIQFKPLTTGPVTGSVSVTSDASDATLAVAVTGTGMTTLAITTQPASRSVTAGQTAAFSVAATGNAPLTYQWKKNGTAIGGATSSSYTTPATASSDNTAQFTVAVTDSLGNTITSNAATLTVTTALVAPSITREPASQTVTAGQTAMFSVTASGTGTLSYQWKKNGAAIAGATSASYTIPATASSENGTQFDVVVTDNSGSATSSAAILTVTAAPVSPTITAQPASRSVTAGQTASFSVTATGTATLTYQWSKNSAAIGGATSASYTTPTTLASDSGAQYSVKVTNSVGSATSSIATLTVTVPPSITAQPASRTVTAGQTATFSVTATGTGTLAYQWNKKGVAINGATSVSYTTPATTAADSGATFTVTVTDSAGKATSSAAVLTVNAPPAISAQPASKTVIAGQSATFSVTVAGTGTITYQWNRNGAAIPGATSASYSTGATTSGDTGAQFTVTVTNGAGSTTSNTATLTVTAATVLLNANKTSLSFPSVSTGTSSAQSVTFTNAGNSNVTISNVTISGAGFTASGVSSGQILTPGNTATLNVTFAPSATGSVTGAVTVASNATVSPAAIALSGTGVAPVTHSVTLGWDAATSAVTGYNLYRATVSGGPYAIVNPSPVATTSYIDLAVQSAQTYFYVATSVDANGESAYSPEVSATIP